MSQSRGDAGRSRGWCSLRLRFDERELALLHGAEQVRGTALAARGGPDTLRSALTLAKAGHKISHAGPRASISLDEGELKLLLDAVRFATDEVHWVTGPGSRAEAATASADDERRRAATLQAFPELVERGLWRSFGLTRDLEALAERLHGALHA
jgi:hypothetical protein